MERSSSIRIWLVVFIAAVICIGPWAAPPAFGEKNACTDDISKFCKDIQPGQGGVLKCMKEHEGELSQDCKTQLAEMKKQGQEASQACEDDIVRLCSDLKPGGGRIVRCLKEHENELSSECKAKMRKKRR